MQHQSIINQKNYDFHGKLMTSLIAWVGVDSRKPASLNFASDSRITWNGNSEIKWDHGRKLFASIKYPEIFGFFGVSFFPQLILSQIMTLIDNDMLFSGQENPTTKFEAIYKIIYESFTYGGYPEDARGNFTIIYGTREHEKMQSVFHLARIDCERKRDLWEWKTKCFKMPHSSEVILIDGTGKSAVEKSRTKWGKTSEKNTTRSIFGAFCDSVTSGKDRFSGGSPQLVSLIRIGSARTYGIIYKNKRYVFGMRVNNTPHINQIDWRNSLLERCDGKTKKRLSKAQKHKDPFTR